MVEVTMNASPTIKLFKSIAGALLEEYDTFEVKTGVVKQTRTLSIECYSGTKGTGILLGSPEYGMKTPTKIHIQKILEKKAIPNGFRCVQLWIENREKGESHGQSRSDKSFDSQRKDQKVQV